MFACGRCSPGWASDSWWCFWPCLAGLVSGQVSLCTEAVSSVGLSVSEGWAAGRLLATLTLYFLLITSNTLGADPLTLQDTALSARLGQCHPRCGAEPLSIPLCQPLGYHRSWDFPLAHIPPCPSACLSLAEMPGPFEKLQAEQQRAAAAAPSQAAAAASLFTAAFSRSLASPAPQLWLCWGTLLAICLFLR